MRKSRIKAQTSSKVIGMMSGTSLDGVDLAFCQFNRGIITKQQKSQWRYHLIAAKTFQYPKYILDIIKTLQSPQTSFLTFKKLQIQYTKFIIQIINMFTFQNSIENYDLLSVHGHTIFHTPKQHITVQILNLNYLAGSLKVDICGNFRQLDVFRGGQGAPLAPYGQQIFPGDAFINFGGIVNISYMKKGFDINFCNMFINYISQKYLNCPFDKDGQIGRNGTPNSQLIQFFNFNTVFKLGHSLAREDFQPFMIKLQSQLKIYKIEEVLASYYQFLSSEIVKVAHQLIKKENTTILCTGGGAKNKFLIELINKKSKFQFLVPNQQLIDFKQAILFGFLGVKMIYGQQNCSSGVGGNFIKGSLFNQEIKSINESKIKSNIV